MLRFQMTACSYMPVTMPLGKIGWNVLSDFKFRMPVPHAFLFIAGGYCMMSMYRQARLLWGSTMTWFKSFFNAQKYLKADNIEEMQDIIDA